MGTCPDPGLGEIVLQNFPRHSLSAYNSILADKRAVCPLFFRSHRSGACKNNAEKDFLMHFPSIFTISSLASVDEFQLGTSIA